MHSLLQAHIAPLLTAVQLASGQEESLGDGQADHEVCQPVLALSVQADPGQGAVSQAQGGTLLSAAVGHCYGEDVVIVVLIVIVVVIVVIIVVVVVTIRVDGVESVDG